jgi:hypothetical protein
MGTIDQENPKLSGAIRAVAVTPNNDTDLGCTRAIYVGVGGDLAVRFAGSLTTITYVGILGGTTKAIQVDRVMAATTALSIVAEY